MKLNSLCIKNFRILEDFTVEKLGRLNLIVGKNNSGKSTVLEALRIYAGNANRSLLINIAESHDEYQVNGRTAGDEEDTLPLESFFTGRHFPAGEKETITIGEIAPSPEMLRLQRGYLIREEMLSEGRETVTRVRSVLKSDLHGIEEKNISNVILVFKNDKQISSVSLDEPSRMRRFPTESQEAFACSYIPTQFVSLDELADEWDKITLTEYAENIKIALNFIEDGFENIAFVKAEPEEFYPSRYPPIRTLKRFAKVKMTGIKYPVPLNSMGDGMLRVLQLALKIFPAKGGFLLIDEFENGLHFSVQEKVWNWLFDLAKELDIQVFATTHSWDCVESFAKVAGRKKDIEGVLFRVGHSARTSDNGKIIATEFDEEKLATITASDVEAR